MKIAVFGSQGMLGNYVSTYLERQGHEIIRLTREDLDVSDFNQYSKLDEILSSVKAVINCAGTIKPVANVQSKEATFMVNSIWPNFLAKKCYYKGTRCFHITTDCIYSGDTGHYDEEALSDVFDDYGFSKSIGDQAQEYCFVIRTSIIGEEQNNKRSLLEWAKSQKGKTVNGFIDHYWNGVTCLQLAKYIEKALDDRWVSTGLQHIYSNTVSKFELLKIISEEFGLDLKVKPVESEHPCNRTLSTINVDYKRQPSLQLQIKELVGFYEESREIKD